MSKSGKRRQEIVATGSEPLKAALVGLAAGLVASFAMNQFQALVTKLSPDEDEGGEPATEKAADKIALATTGAAVPDESKALAGNAVHYAFGAALGVGYALAAEYRPEVTAGYGSSFGTATAALFDEGAVPALGLGEAPWKTPASTHAYTGASHLVFGGVLEAVRRVLRPLV